MGLNLKFVESFVAVAETLSFSTAAEQTHTVQSAISAQIRQLEEHLGRTLLERGRGRPVRLTDEGAAFLVQARRLLALADEVARPVSAGADQVPLRLGTTITFALSVVPEALAELNWTGTVPVKLRTARSHALLDLVEAEEIDVALILDQGPHATRRYTTQIDLCWVAARRFRHRPDAVLPMAFLEDARDLRRHAFAALDANGAFRASLSTHPDPIGMRAVVSAGLAITVLPRIAIVPPLEDVGPTFGLPPLGSLPVSIYAERTDAIEPVLRCLQGQLRAR